MIYLPEYSVGCISIRMFGGWHFHRNIQLVAYRRNVRLLVMYVRYFGSQRLELISLLVGTSSGARKQSKVRAGLTALWAMPYSSIIFLALIQSLLTLICLPLHSVFPRTLKLKLFKLTDSKKIEVVSWNILHIFGTMWTFFPRSLLYIKLFGTHY